MIGLLFLVFVLALAACGEDEQVGRPAATGPSLTVAEALDSDAEGPLLVRGVLVERDGELRLCSAILESHPPQCGEPSLAIDGDGGGGVGDQVELLGEVEDAAIRVSR